MTKRRRRFAKATRALTDPVTGRVLGWTYRWDTGEGSSLAAGDVPPDLTPASEPANDPASPGQGGGSRDGSAEDP